jgi:hypothetical protein
MESLICIYLYNHTQHYRKENIKYDIIQSFIGLI